MMAVQAETCGTFLANQEFFVNAQVVVEVILLPYQHYSSSFIFYRCDVSSSDNRLGGLNKHTVLATANTWQVRPPAPLASSPAKN